MEEVEWEVAGEVAPQMEQASFSFESGHSTT
jgi:hypothetical protein